MTKVNTRPYDPANYINTIDDAVAVIDAAFEDGDPAVVSAMLGAVARSKGMSAVAREAGLSRETLYRVLSEDGNPTLSTLTSVLKALGMRLSVTSAP